jgi:RND superfamily putative drug exporter
LGAAATLVTNANFGQVDDRVLPADNPASIASQVFRDYFSSFEGSPIEILLPKNEDVDSYATELSEKSKVVRVEVETGVAQNGVLTPLDATMGWPFLKFTGTDYNLVRVIAEVEPRTIAGEDLIREIRDLSDTALVGGSSAVYTDSQAGIADNMLSPIFFPIRIFRETKIERSNLIPLPEKFHIRNRIMLTYNLFRSQTLD